MRKTSTMDSVSPSGSAAGTDDKYSAVEDEEAIVATPTSKNSKTATKLVRSRREAVRKGVHRPPMKPTPENTRDDEVPSVSHSLASADTEEVKHTRLQGPNPASGGVGSLINASPTALRSFRRFRANRKRVPGGAAAKLIGRTCEEAEEDIFVTDDGDEALEVKPPSDEFERIRRESKAEFSVGSNENRRYHVEETKFEESNFEETLENAPSEASLPSILNRSEVFHENATAAVPSLLSPSMVGVGDKKLQEMSILPVLSTRSTDFDFVNQSSLPKMPHVKSPFSPPPRFDDASSVVSNSTNANYERPEYEQQSATGKSPLEQPLLSKKGEQRVEEMKKQMKDPNKTLSDLISAIATPSDGIFSRGYMVRRKNACGALQVLTAKKVHRAQICWTVGVLPALSSVLEDSGNRDLEEIFPDAHTRREYVEARKRAVSALMNLAMPQENRLAMFHSPRLISNIVRVINMDVDESRKGCCAVMAHLAKTKENRLLMAQVPGLLDAITDVIEPSPLKLKPGFQRSDDAEDDDASSAMSQDEGPLYSISTSDASAGVPGIADSYMSEEKNDEIDERSSSEVKATRSEDPAKASKRYDEDPNECLHGARQNVYALLSHLIKEKDNAYVLVRHKYLTETLVEISKLNLSPSHEHAVKLLAHCTRHRGNSKHIVFKLRKVVPVLVKASFSQNDESRKFACFALQNLSQDKPCRQELAATPNLLSALCVRVRQAADPEERLSAIHALKNLTDEPANLIPMTNTPECFATLMQIAHASDDSVTETMQYLGCDALATLSHWFRSIATSGQRIDVMKQGQQPTKELFVPSLKIITWEQWH